jgi:hypothetical protein
LSIIETLVVFAGIPLAVVVVIAGLVYAGGGRTNDRRYRPGRPFDFTPVWFLSAPDSVAASDGHQELTAAPDHRADGGSGAEGRQLAAGAEGRPTAVGDVTGGASDRW